MRFALGLLSFVALAVSAQDTNRGTVERAFDAANVRNFEHSFDLRFTDRNFLNLDSK